MNWLRFVAFLLVLDAIIILIRPDYVKKYIGLLAQGMKIYLAALIKATVGIIFLFGASNKCNIQWVIVAFGVIALAGAVFIIAVPQKSRAMANWLAGKSITTLRFFAIIYLLIAGFLVYSS